MKKNTLFVVFTFLLVTVLTSPAGNAAALDVKNVAGTYASVSNPPFGDNARGQLILGQDGYYSLVLARATLPKIAAGTRVSGTAEENSAIVGGSIAHVGKYTVDAKDKTITFYIEFSTFPNWDGTTSKRAMLNISGDMLSFTNSAPSDGSSAFKAVWKRVR